MPNGNWMAVRGGGAFELDTVTPESIDYRVIAWALSGIVRYNGHAPVSWTVADHVVGAALLAATHQLTLAHRFSEPMLAHVRLAAHHDDGEAYYGDQIRPWGAFLGPGFAALQRRVDSAIIRQLDLAPVENDQTERFDLLMLEAERRTMFSDCHHWTASTVCDDPLFPAALKLVQRMVSGAGKMPRELKFQRLMALEALLTDRANARKSPFEIHLELVHMT